MTAVKFLSHVRSLGIKLWVDDGRLRYSAPAGVLTTGLRNELIERKNEIISFLHAANTAAQPTHLPILRGSREVELPLSFAQERLWFLHQLDPENPVYNAPAAVRLNGPLQVAALQQTLSEIVRRHEVLRTTFALVNGQPLQIISRVARVNLRIIDLRHLPESDLTLKAERLAAAELQRPFNLAQGPLLRATLLRINDEEHIVLLTMHHIVSDGWSLSVLVQEVAVLYAAFSAGNVSPMPDLTIQYADFAQWQRQRLIADGFQTEVEYWKRQLGSGPPALELPTDKPRPETQTYRGSSQLWTLSESLSHKLRALAYSEEATLFMTVLAAFQALLYHYTGQSVITAGTNIANRNRAETEGLIGFFANILVLCTDVSGDPTFSELLRRVREVTLGAYAHQDLPFEKLVEEIQPARNLSRTPLVQVGFSLLNVAMQPLELPDLTLSQMQVQNGTSKFDLTLVMWETAEGLGCAFEYNTDLFEAATIARMAESFQILLQAIAGDASLRLSKLPPFTDKALSPVKPLKQHAGQFDDLSQRSNLTRNQLLMWMGQKLQPDVTFYNMIVTFAISRELDPSRFAQAFQAVVNSTDALRTVMIEDGGVPQQCVLAELQSSMEYLDYSGEPDAFSRAQAWMQARGRVGFDLEKSQLDSALIKVADANYIWFFNSHHLIIDLWSEWLMLERLSYFYERLLRGETDELVAFPLFQDFVAYERRYRSSPQYFEAEAYWKQKVAQRLEPVNFYGRLPIIVSPAVQRSFYSLGAGRAERLREIASREGFFTKTLNASMFNIFAAILFTYLNRVSGNTYLSLGTPFHNRREGNFKQTVGLFMEVLPLRITIEKDDTFLTMVRKISAEASETLKHSQCAIGNPKQKKVYDVFLNYNTARSLSFLGEQVDFQWLSSGQGSDSLSLHIHDYGPSGEIEMMFDFHCDVFDERQRQQVFQHFLQVVDAFLENSNQLVQRVSVLTPEERQVVLYNLSKTTAPLPKDRTVIHLFEEIVSAVPDRVAVVLGEMSLTYGELNARANQVAHHLSALGVGPEARVGICVDRCVEMIIGVVGVLKAGGAYVPLDPAYPTERLAFMLEDAQVKVLLTQEHLVEGLPDHKAQVVCLGPDWNMIDRQSKHNPVYLAQPGNTAYAIYTSGSTGKAKGVLVTHQSLINAYLAWEEAYQLRYPDDCHLQMASFSFDVFSGDLVRALCSGSKLVLCPWEWLLAPDSLYELMREQHVNCGEFVPAVTRNLVKYLEESEQRLDFMRLLIVGSDTWSVGEFESLQRLCSPETRLINSYGLAEATIDSSYFESVLPASSTNKLVPIGLPFVNSEFYLLDAQMEPVPFEMQSELHIGGMGLARGYINRPDLTAEKFIPNPFSEVPGARLYRTGDLAQCLPDGNIEFLGRIDNQVKIRGFRIELEEIETVLKDHPAVREAVVNAIEDGPGNKLLVAYVVAEQGQAPATSELRSFLRQSLAEYMIPSAFVNMVTIPLTPNGKVDRKALPRPQDLRADLNEAYVAPRTEIEQKISAVWQETLRVERVGIHDNFFDLGGHSLLIVQIHSKLRDAFGKRVSIVDLFKYPTVSSLANYLALDEQAQSSVEQQSDRAEKLNLGKSRLQQQLKLRRKAAK